MYYRINAPRVAHEMIDGEVIAIDFDTGNYFSLDGTGAAVWSLLMQGATIDGLVDALAARYEGSHEMIVDSIHPFLLQLQEEGLVVTEEPPASANGTNGAGELKVAALLAKPPFTLPTLELYTDMQELLLLDPIHEVDEQGWPTRK